jgi:hypothetical protein
LLQSPAIVPREGSVRFLLLALAVLLVAGQGCRTTAPILNVTNAPLGAPPGGKVGLEDVSRSVWAAGKRLGWEMQEIRPGEITGTLKLRQHVAVVAITFDTTTFSINYRSSVNLRQHDNEIHRNYNNWINNLSKAIQAEMAGSR